MFSYNLFLSHLLSDYHVQQRIWSIVVFSTPMLNFLCVLIVENHQKYDTRSIPNVSPWYLLPWNECFCPSAYCQNTDHGPVCVEHHITSHLFDLIYLWLAGKPTTDQMIYLSSAHPWNTIGFVSTIRWYLVPYPGVNIDAEKIMEKTLGFPRRMIYKWWVFSTSMLVYNLQEANSTARSFFFLLASLSHLRWYLCEENAAAQVRACAVRNKILIFNDLYISIKI